MNTQGVSLYVLPYNDQGSVAVAVLDAREGFAFPRGGQLSPVTDVFVKVAGGAQARALGVEYLTVQYVSAAGRTIMTLTAPRSSVAALAVGALSEDEFRAQLQGDIDFPAFMAEQMDSLQEFLQES